MGVANCWVCIVLYCLNQFQKLRTLALLGINQTPSDNRIYTNDMPTINEETISALVNNCPELSTIVLHNYVCGDGGQAVANFMSHLQNLKRYFIVDYIDYSHSST